MLEPSPSSAAPSASATIPSAPARRALNERFVLLALFAFASLVYITCTGHGFVVDDTFLLVENPYVKSFHYLRQILFSDFWGFRGQGAHSNFYRPLVMLTLLGEYMVLGLRPAWYHLVNVLINATVVVMVYRLARQWWPRGSGALWAALLFAVLPLHVEAVSPVSGLSDLGCALFMLLSLWVYVRAPRSGEEPSRGRWWGSAGLLLLALLYKEVALMLLPLLVYYEHFVLRDGGRRFLERCRRYLPHLLVVLFYLAVRISVLGGFTTLRQRPDATLTDTVQSGLSLLGIYLYKFVWPQYLTYFLTFQAPRGWTDFYVLMGAAWALLAVVGFFRCWRRATVVSFAILWFFLTVGPVLNIHWLGVSVYGERFMYIPSVAFCWLVGAGLGRLGEFEGTQPGLRWKVASVFAVIIVLAYGIRTEVRVPDWKNNFTLAEATLRVDPGSGSYHIYLGNTYRQIGNRDRARREYIQAIALDPGGVEGYLDLAGVFMDDGAAPTAAMLVQRAAQIDPTFPETFYTWGVIELAQGNKDRARQMFERAVALNPSFGDALNNLGVLSLNAGNLEAAQGFLERAVRANPAWVDSHMNLGVVLARRNQFRPAEAEFRRAIQLDPARDGPYLALASLYEQQKNLSAALEQYQAAVRVQPASGNAWFRLGVLALKMGNVAEATRALVRAEAIQPGSPLVHLQLGLAYSAAGKGLEARHELETCLSLDPHNDEAREALRKIP
jgi:Tfp pilus assembly protein PilF